MRTGTARHRPITGAQAGLAVGVMTILAFVLRLAGIDQALYGDELFTYDLVTRFGVGDLLRQVQDTSITPPLHYLLAHAAQTLGNPPETVRLPSIAAGVAAIPVAYLVGERTVGRRAALLAAGFLAISPFFIYFGDEARAYACLVLLLLLSTLGLVRALEGGATRWWALFAVASCATLYTHYTGAIYLLAQAIWALIAYRERWRALAIANGLAIVGFLPWVPAFLDQRRNPGVEAVGAGFPGGFWGALGGYADRIVRLVGGNPFAELRDLPGRPALLVMGLAVIVALAMLAAGRARRREPPDPGAALRSPLLLLGLLAVALPLGLIAYRIGGTNLYSARNLLPSLPAIMLLAGALFARLRGAAGLAVAALFAAGLGVGAVKTLGPDGRRPPWNLAARWVDSHAGPRDTVVQLDIVGILGLRRALFYDMIIFFERPHRWLAPLMTKEAARSRRVVVVSSTIPGHRILYVKPPVGGPWRLVSGAHWRGFNGVIAYTWVRAGRSHTATHPCPPVVIRNHRMQSDPVTACSTIVPRP